VQILIYFSLIVLTCILTGWLAFYAWCQSDVPGARAYFWVAFSSCLLALAEALFMLAPGRAMALFWFNLRVIFTASLPVLWLLFVLEYSGHKDSSHPLDQQCAWIVGGTGDGVSSKWPVLDC
jgi:hypothetical protein